MRYQNSVSLRIWGDDALFSDPVTRVSGEKCSYQVPTYEALHRILNNVYWKPTFIWHIDAVRIMNPVSMLSRGMKPMHYQNEGNDLSYYAYLQNVDYQVKAHIEWNPNRPDFAKDRDMDKHLKIANRAIRQGGRKPVFLGTSECVAFVEPCIFGEGRGFYDDTDKDFGIMLHGITYPDEAYSDVTRGMMTVRFWDAKMERGVITFLRPEECTMIKPVREMNMKVFDSNKEERRDDDDGPFADGSEDV